MRKNYILGSFLDKKMPKLQLDMSDSIEILVEKIFDNMREVDGSSLDTFIFAIKYGKYIPVTIPKKEERGEFLKNYYAYFRAIDNYIDGDADLPEGVTPSVFIDDRIKYVEEFAATIPEWDSPQDVTIPIPRHPLDNLIIHCFDLSSKFNESFIDETIHILNSIKFDAERKQENGYEMNLIRKYNEKELSKYFDGMDIKGTGSGMLKILNEDSSKLNYVEKVGIATRMFYTIRDLAEDILVGYLNIPTESLEKYNILDVDLEKVRDRAVVLKTNIEAWRQCKNKNNVRKKELKERNLFYQSIPENVKEWARNYAQEGLQLIDTYKSELKNSELRFFTKLVGKFVYEGPTKKGLEKYVKILST